MTIIPNPSHVERSSTETSPKMELKSQLSKPPQFDRSISHVVQRRVSHNSESPIPSPTIGKPQLRWFEAASMDTVNLGSSVDVFLEDGRRVSLSHPIKPLETVSETKAPVEPAAEPKADHIPDVLEPTSTSCCSWLVNFFDLTLFRDLVYVNIMLGMSFAIFAEINFSILTPFIFKDLSYTTPQIASFLSLIAVADIASRFCAPFVGDRMRQPPRIMYMMSMVLLISTRMS